MCELLARDATIPADEMFTAGLLSLSDAIMDRPVPEILSQLPLSALVREALAGGASRTARIVDTVRHQNRGDLGSLAGTGFSAQVRVHGLVRGGALGRRHHAPPGAGCRAQTR